MARIAQTQAVVGVDISSDYIRATHIERVGEAYFLRNIGMIKTPEGAYEDGFISDPKAIGAQLKILFRERRFDTTNVATAMRGKGIVCRIITLPSMPQDRLSNLIENEVNRYVMFSDQDKVVYYYPLEEFDEYERRKVNVLLVVAQKSWCRSYFNAFKEAKLNLTGIDFSTFAILRELKNSTRNATSGNTMTVSLDSSGASLNIFHNDVLRFTRQIRLDSTDSKSIANGFKDRVLAETLLSMQFYQAESNRGEPLQKLIVSLGATGADVVNDTLARGVDDIRVITHSPFSNIKVNPGDFPGDIMEKVDTNFLTSVGVSLKGQEMDLLPFEIDLLPAEITEGRVFYRHAIIFLLLILTVVLAFFAAGAYMDMSEKSMTQKTQELQMQYDRDNAVIRSYDRQISKRTGSNLVTIEQQNTENMLPLFEEVKKVVPKNVQLNGMSVQMPDSKNKPLKVSFSGFAETKYDFLMFKGALEHSESFRKVDRGPWNTTTVFGKPMVEFTINCSYVPEEM